MSLSGLFEVLESRQHLSVFTVSNLNDSGAGSLRQAVLDANNASGADSIEFDGSLSAGTIPLTTGSITISDELTINGPGRDVLSVSGQRLTRVFGIANGVTATINDLTIKWGQQDAGVGGQVYVDQNATLAMSRVTLVDSQAMHGGAIYNNFGTLTLTNCSIYQGRSFTHGGAIFSAGGPVTLTNCTIANNTANNDGGGLYSINTATVSGTTFSDNTAGGRGGGIFNGADLTVTNSTLSGNTATQPGGAISNYFSLSLSIFNSTIVGNTSGGTGGIANEGAGVFATVTSTIVAGNAGGDTSGTINSTNNLIGGDPMLGPLANNGGPTQTRAVLDGSPAIGAGSNPSNLTTDQRGGPFVRGTNVDIGAFQRQSVSMTVNSDTDENDDDFGAGDFTLREAIRTANENPGPDTIGFAASLHGHTITLGGTHLAIYGDLSINGPGANLLTVSANGASRVFYIYDTSVSVSGLTLSGGAVGAGHGGAVFVQSGAAAVFSRCTVSGNSASETGGGIAVHDSTLSIVESTVSGNSAAGDGGGIFALRASLVIENCTVSGNSAGGWGGGVGGFTDQPTSVTIRSSTIADNTADSDSNASGVGGGIHAKWGPWTVVSTIIAGNTNAFTSAPDDAAEGTLNNSTSTNNLIQDSATSGGISNGVGGNLVGVDPLLGPLAGNGGPTQTRALLVGSPAINRGSNPFNFAVDQRGSPRSFGGSPDIGAFEVGAVPTIASLSPSSASVVRGQGLTLTANGVADADSAVTRVDFYRDANANGTPDTGELIGSDTDGADGYTYTLTGAQANALPDGQVTFLAVATSVDGGVSAPRQGAATVHASHADSFISSYSQSAVDGLVDGDAIRDSLLSSVENVATSNAYWGAQNNWFQDANGDVWSLWHGGDVHRSATRDGEHVWVLTNLTDAAGLSGTMNFAPGSLSGLTTGWNAFNIQGIRDGKLVALWWSPEGSAGTWIDQQGQTQQGRGLGLRGNGWVLNEVSTATTALGGAAASPPSDFLAYSESQSNGRTEFDPRTSREIANTGMAVVLVDSDLRVFVISFSVSQRDIPGSRPDLNSLWILEPLANVPSIADFGLTDQLGMYEQAYADAATP